MRKILVATLVSMLAVAGALAAPYTAPPPSKAPTAQMIVGDVASVNAKAGTFSVKTQDNTESFTLGKDATLTLHGASIHLTDLKVGERVEVKFMLDGAQRRASYVHVVSQPPKTS